MMPARSGLTSSDGEEFVGDNPGLVIPYLDVAAKAKAILALCDGSQRRHHPGERAAAKVREHHDVTVAAPRPLQVMARTLAESRREDGR